MCKLSLNCSGGRSYQRETCVEHDIFTMVCLPPNYIAPNPFL